VSTTALGVMLVLVGFLAGSIPFGFLLARAILGVDVRTVGSGNIGATNVARAGGKGMGIAVLVLDVLKAVGPMLVARALLGRDPHTSAWVALVGTAAFLGHVFTPWLRFRGGKGVATGLGVFLVLAPAAALAGLVAFAIAYGATRMSSLGSLSGTLVATVVIVVAAGPTTVPAWTALAIALVVFLRHRDNIRRLVRGEERKMRV
jgi:glycerol-3-phosphate acyltransferase PlsY